MKLQTKLLVTLCPVLFSANLLAQSFVNFDEESLSNAKEALNNKTAHAESTLAYNQLLTLADSLLTLQNPTVMDKKISPPTGDKHDYLSISRYWWPDESKSDELPWIRKDGQTNPSTQNNDVDKQRIELTTKSIQALALAYYFSGEDQYAKKGVSLIRTWFLDENTLMNPNLEFAQSVPGINKGRRSGILDGRIIPQRVLDAITMFSDSKYWSEEDDTKMNVWLTQYLAWLTTSDLGKEGAKQTNNHGSWYEYQVAAVSYYLGDTKQTKQAVKNAEIIFSQQFDSMGAQPHELERTRSYFYSTFNLEAITSTAIIAEKVGLSMWEYESKNNATLIKGIDFLIPAANGNEWIYNSSVEGVTPDNLAPLLAAIPEKIRSKEQSELLTKLLQGLETNDNKKAYQDEIYKKFLLYMPQYIK
ncbi:hypothetical protein A6E05_13775 [Aliivibrio sp. 1S165]|uniref:alginate lyase family protein n=1 Tax=unclassified Aliivibrio TaxID=2645654 RepID=UPI00080E627F|nr:MULTISPECIES: alginate lyase family protein [unclassified Aliivibrio]OCH17354.1 hypothetical protein A6E05_13775 [Aliivibrio sp. 1S165]OCH34348.1 hypothetical protein A6E06_00515 [Aliivibrio sp. 1S175]